MQLDSTHFGTHFGTWNATHRETFQGEAVLWFSRTQTEREPNQIRSAIIYHMDRVTHCNSHLWWGGEGKGIFYTLTHQDETINIKSIKREKKTLKRNRSKAFSKTFEGQQFLKRKQEKSMLSRTKVCGYSVLKGMLSKWKKKASGLLKWFCITHRNKELLESTVSPHTHTHLSTHQHTGT